LNITLPANYISGPKYISVYYCNNDIAFATSWTTGTNTRNLTISVGGTTTRIEVPLSGRSSELYSVDLGWEDSGTFGVLTEGWPIDGVEGDKVLIGVGNVGGSEGVQSYGADFVGLEVWW
jgi:alpha-galactosidase